MLKRLAVAGAVSTLWLAAVDERLSVPQAQQAQSAILYPNYGPPPASLDELWERAQLIVRGVIEDSHVRPLAPANRPTVVTDHRLRVTEVLKGALPGAGARVVHVLQTAGSLTIDGIAVTVDPGAMPVLRRQQDVLLFLNEWRTAGGYSIAFGPAGLYLLDDDEVRVPVFMKPDLDNNSRVSKADFLRALRQRAGRK